MAMSMLSSTIMLQQLYTPNISRAQNLVKSFTPVSSKSLRLTSPNTAQNSDCSVSKSS